LAARQAARQRIDVAAPLAQIYINEARTSGDLRFLGYAEAVLAPWVSREPAVPAALVLQATILQSRHEFTAALAMLQRSLAARPDDPQAWLTRATVLRVLGKHDDALAACAELRERAGAPVTLICEQGVRAQRGALADAYQRLSTLDDRTLPAEVRTWRASELGEMAAHAGREQDAELWFRQALALAPGDFYVRAAYADLLLRQRRAHEAVALLAGRESIEPLLLRLALAQQQLQDPGLARSRQRLDAAFTAEEQRGESVHGREHARSLLELEGQPREALRVALRNWQVQREPDDLLVLVMAARASGTPQAAGPALALAQAQGLQDARIPTPGPGAP
jgi:predicted Zn-dependent protease